MQICRTTTGTMSREDLVRTCLFNVQTVSFASQCLTCCGCHCCPASTQVTSALLFLMFTLPASYLKSKE